MQCPVPFPWHNGSKVGGFVSLLQLKRRVNKSDSTLTRSIFLTMVFIPRMLTNALLITSSSISMNGSYR